MSGKTSEDEENSRSQLDVYLAWSIINEIIRRSIYPCECTAGGLEGRGEKIPRGGGGKNTGMQSTTTGVAVLISVLLKVHIPLLRCAWSPPSTAIASSNTTSGCQNMLDRDLLGCKSVVRMIRVVADEGTPAYRSR